MTGDFENHARTSEWVGRFRRYQVLLEWAYWPVVHSTQAMLTASSVVMEYARRGTPIDSWEPYVWEFSSVASAMLGIWLIIQFDRRFPLDSRYFLRNLAAHAAFSLVYSAVHVIGMVAIRELVYQQAGRNYDFGDLSFEVWYEYRKDAVTYLSIVTTLYIYRFISSRIISEASPIRDGDAENDDKRTERFLVRKLGKEFLLKADDVEWIEAAGNYMNMYALNNIYPVRETMTGLEKRLGRDHFVRVHRSYIVNLDFIESITPGDSGDGMIHMRDGARVRLSRRYRDTLRARMQ